MSGPKRSPRENIKGYLKQSFIQPDALYVANQQCQSTDVNKDWTCEDKDKDKDQAYKNQDKHKDYTCKDKDKDKDKDFTHSYLLQVAAKPTIAIKQQQ